jgi:hypothetical protein
MHLQRKSRSNGLRKKLAGMHRALAEVGKNIKNVAEDSFVAVYGLKLVGAKRRSRL